MSLTIKHMQKKFFLYPALFLTCGTLLVFSCKKSFLDVQPKGQLLESNYYQTPDEAYAALVAIYDPLGQEAGSSDNTYADPLGGLNAASDVMPVYPYYPYRTQQGFARLNPAPV